MDFWWSQINFLIVLDERVGNLTIVSHNPKNLSKLLSQITLLIRGMYSNPPNHGARVVATSLNDPVIFEEWKTCIRTMSDRIRLMRTGLYEKLVALRTPGDWRHIVSQIGMFSYTGLNPRQVDFLRATHHIYMLKSGRVNMCGLNTNNLDHVAKAINEAVLKYSEWKA